VGQVHQNPLGYREFEITKQMVEFPPGAYVVLVDGLFNEYPWMLFI